MIRYELLGTLRRSQIWQIWLLSDPVTRAFVDLQSCGYDNLLVLEIVALLEFNGAADHDLEI